MRAVIHPTIWRTNWRRGLAAFAVVLLAGFTSACRPAAGEGPVTLRYATPYSPAHPFSRADLTWIRQVESASNGRLRIEPYWGGSLIDESDSIRELAAGVADVSYILPIYLRAGAHFTRGQTPFYDGATDMHLQNQVMRGLWSRFPEFRAELASVKPLIVTGGSSLEVLTRARPVRSLEDLRGLRLRAPSEITTVLDMLGVNAEFMPMGEVYTALAKGTIDGVIAPIDTLKAMRFAEVVRYCTLLSIPRGAYYSRGMNLQTWEALPPSLQKAIEDTLPAWEEAVIEELTMANDGGQRLAAERDVEFITMPASDLQRFRDIYAMAAQRHADELDERGLPGRAAYALARKIIRTAANAGAAVSP